MKEKKGLYEKLFIIIIFYFVTYNSTLSTTLTFPFLYSIRYIFLILMIVLLLFKIFQSGIDKRILVAIVLTFVGIMEFLLNKDTAIIMCFIFITYCLYMSVFDIVYSYLLGIFYGVLFIITLSIIGVLPKVNQLLSFGFNNPNTLGFYLLLICISYICLNWNSLTRAYLLIYVLCFLFCFFILEDYTASICMVLFLLFYSFDTEKPFSGVLKIIFLVSPTILFSLSWILASLYSRYSWVNDLNDFLSHRLQIWNYYLSLYPIKLMPQVIVFQSANEYQRLFYGVHLPVIMQGGFDGSYIYMLLTQGFIISVIMLFIITYAMYKVLNYNTKPLAYVLFILIMFALTETTPISFITYFQSYFIMICFSISVNSYRSITDFIEN